MHILNVVTLCAFSVASCFRCMPGGGKGRGGGAKFLSFITFRSCTVFYVSVIFIVLSPNYFASLKQHFLSANFVSNFCYLLTACHDVICDIILDLEAGASLGPNKTRRVGVRCGEGEGTPTHRQGVWGGVVLPPQKSVRFYTSNGRILVHHECYFLQLINLN